MTSKLLIIRGDKFRSLAGLTFNHHVVELVNCGDIHPYKSPPVFAEAETIFVRTCDKNFVFYWLNSSTFPKAKNIYLNSHPCDASVFRRFTHPDTIIHLDDKFFDYKMRWAGGLDSVVLITKSDIEKELNKCSQIE